MVLNINPMINVGKTLLFAQRIKATGQFFFINRNYIHNKSPNIQEEVQENDQSSESVVKKLLNESSDCVVTNMGSEEDNWISSPYPKGTNVRDQSKLAFRPNIDPRETSILLFPGQGTQYVGMGGTLLRFPIVKDLFEGASEILGFNLLKLCQKGPKEELDKTVNSQPAIFVCSLGAVERLKDERPAAIESCIATAGFSLGEITALTFAGAFTFEQALRLVKVRAEAMQIASEVVESGMMTVLLKPNSKLGEAMQKAKEWCVERGIEKPVCTVANYLYPGCKVVAGHKEALKFIQENVKTYNLVRTKNLPVSGAFHTDLMRPAVLPFINALKKMEINDPLIGVHSNIDGKKYRDAGHIVRQLPKQIYKPVRWEQILHILYERSQEQHFPRSFECGPGRSMKTVLKLVNAKAWDSCYSIDA